MSALSQNDACILVTGGAGFVGSNLCLSLKKDFPKSKVIALDNLKRRGSELNLPRLKSAGIEFVHGDIRNPEDIECVGPFDLLIECSAEPSVLAGYSGSPGYLLNTNLVGTIHCLEAVRKHSAKFIFLSTSRVYPIEAINRLAFDETPTRFKLRDGQRADGITTFGVAESFTLNGARSLYGATKLASELLCQEYIAMYGLKGVINRCGVISGPWQMGKVDQGFVVLWVARHMFGGRLSYLGYGGEGKQVRDVLHINDLYDLIKCEMNQIDSLSGRTFNVGGGARVSTSLSELTELVQAKTNRQVVIDRVKETRPADIPFYISDCREIEKATGWKPKISMNEIVHEVTEWIQENESALRPILQ